MKDIIKRYINHEVKANPSIPIDVLLKMYNIIFQKVHKKW